MRREHGRRSIRLPGYDYGGVGGYFVTLVVAGRVNLFGDVVAGEMALNAYGRAAHEEWIQTGVLRPNVVVPPTEFIVMPNHIHGIIWLRGGAGDGSNAGAGDGQNVGAGDGQNVGAGDGQNVGAGDGQNVGARVGAQRAAPLPQPPQPPQPQHPQQSVQPRGVVAGSLGAVVRAYKSAVTRRINQMRGTLGEVVWQRNYYEHVIRDADDHARILAYIQQNPAQWDHDRENPESSR